MARLPFNSDRIPEPDVGKPAKREAERYGELIAADQLTVTQACEWIRRVIADRMPSSMKIVGEVSNFSDRKHWYFSIKDEQSVLSCVM